jgi:dihydroorotase-like cyclic amidohydrolase
MKSLIVLLLVVCSQLAIAQLPQKSYVLTNVNLFNGIDNKIYPSSLVFIKAGKIERIGKVGDPIAKEYEVIDCLNNYAIPGMIDCHTHIDNLESARRALLSGVTTFRTAGVSAYQDVSLRDLARSNRKLSSLS